jgi:type II secretory pathway component PulM
MDVRNPIVAAWDASSPKRRRWLGVFAVAAVAIALIAALRPLPAAIARAESDVARTRSLLDVAQTRSADNESLARSSTPLRPGDLRPTVEGVMARFELRAAPVASATSEGRYAVVVDDARFDALVTALDALSRDAGVRVVAATLTARVEPGRVRADLTFAR